MAFVNEKLTAAQREEIAEKKIKNPLQPNQFFIPYFWTADYERNAFLINVGSYHDSPEEILFLFLLNCNTFLFTLKMQNVDYKTKEWIFINFRGFDGSVKFDECFLMNIFREALSEYKYNGLPRDHKQQFNMITNF